MFHKYQHVARLGTNETDGIEMGECFIFPKLDGTNGSLWWDGEKVQAGSRNRHLTPDADNQGFLAHAMFDRRYELFFRKHPHWRLFGEWLVPHTLRTYREDAWRKFYVFDVVADMSEERTRFNDHGVNMGSELVEDYRYVHPDVYQSVLDDFEIDYIPYTHVIKNPRPDDLYSLLDKNTFLMQDGEVGEGIVIKNYEYVNKWGRVTWAKLVRNEFKEHHVKSMGATVREGSQGIEEAIVDLYVTESLVRKELAKLTGDKPIQPRLLSTVYHCILTEETWNFVKKFKNPVIDFKRLQKLVTARTKEYAPEYF